MSYEIPRYGRKQIRKAGKALAQKDFAAMTEAEARAIVNNWRAAHAYPMNLLYSSCRRTAEDYKGAIVVQRLKRLDSITAKLNRIEGMGLDNVQDLGGCRVILKSVSEVVKFKDEFKRKKLSSKFVRCSDYISNPKDSGYRGIHLVYSYEGKKDAYKNMKVEIQVRSKLQHAWATAVEIMSLRHDMNLKASEGDEDILRYMELVAALFAIREGMPTGFHVPETHLKIFLELFKIDPESRILKMLNSITVNAHNASASKDRSGYYLIERPSDILEFEVSPFSEDQLNSAIELYGFIEKERPKSVVVLVSAASIRELRKAYPNYFYDVTLFTMTLAEELKTLNRRIKGALTDL